MRIITWIYFLICFIFRFLWHIIVYTLSVLPASVCDAYSETKNQIRNSVTGWDDNVPPPPWKNDRSNCHRKRRGHRGGRKHKRSNH